MQLVSKNDPILTTPCQKFDFANPPFDPIEFAYEMVKFLHEYNGIGLAANQVGVPYQVFALRASPENYVCYNPKVVMPSEETIILEEGCLTYPGLFVKIKRPRHVKVRFQTPNGETRTETFTGMTARAFLHEMDHLEGKIFYNQANKYHRDQAFSKWKNK
jgi:peptide deformylase